MPNASAPVLEGRTWDRTSWLKLHEPGLIANVRQEALLRFGNSDDAETFLGSLKKAGLTPE